MKILVECIHYPVASGRFIARAFRRLGHEVRSTGPRVGNEIWGMKVDERWTWEPDFDPTRDDWRPDLMVCADSGYYLDWHPTPQTPLVLWGVDNHVRDYTELGQQFDALFLAHSWGSRMGEPNVYWLPPCYDPVAHTVLGLARDIDVALVGYPYDERLEIVQRMQSAGFRVLAALGLLWDDYNALYNRAKIALVRSVRGDIPQRFFENLAQGCCILADEARDLRRMGYLPDVHYAAYASPEEAVEKAQRLLSIGVYVDLARRGREQARGETWDARALTLLRTLDAMELAPGLEINV